MNTLTRQLETLLRSAQRKARGELRFLGVRCDSSEELPEHIDLSGERWPVRRVRSPLEARLALVDAGADGRALLVAPRALEDPGLEVTARLAGKKLQDIEPWALVREQFQARRLDRRVVKTGAWVAHELLSNAPPGGYAPAPSGLLDLDTVWAALFARLGLAGARPGVAELVAASAEGGLAGRWRAAGVDLRDAAARRLAESAGAAGELIAAGIAKGHGEELVPLGLVLELAVSPELAGDPRTLLLRGRLESFGLHLDEPEHARPWAEEAARWMRAAWERGDEARRARASAAMERAEALVEELRARDLAGASAVLRSGLEARTARLAEALVTAGAGAFDRAGAEAAQARFDAHLLVQLDPNLAERRARALDALRLARWLASAEAEPATLAAHADRYRQSGAWVDRARLSIARGEGERELATVYGLLVERAARRREAQNAAFAQRLARVLEGAEGAGELLHLEDVLPRVVAPLAEELPVLLVVMDGMGESIAEELVEDLRRRWRFQRMSPDAEERLPAVIGLLPSVTEVCRASLLCGAPRVGGQAQELEGFEELAARFGWRGRATQQRILFHQGDLTGRNDALASDVKKAIDSGVRVVAVVVNAVDDQLKGARQLQPRWSLAHVPVLQELLDEAELAGRAVVLTADHGHVVDAGRTRKLGSGDKDGRWRNVGGALDAGEIELCGARVLKPAPGGPCVVPWSEELRYANVSAGYHGGAAPQEVVTPLVVLVPDSRCERVKGWSAEVHVRPWWWDGREEAELAVPTPRPVAPAPAPKPPKRGDITAPMAFAKEAPPAAAGQPAWVARLFACEMWSVQRKLAGRTPPPEGDIASVLAALAGAGGRLSLEALRNRTRFTQPRLGGLLTAMSRILNVDGYAVLELDRGAEEVALDERLLFTQFGLDPEAGA